MASCQESDHRIYSERWNTMCFRRNSAILACSRLTLLLLSSDLKLGVFLSPLRTFATMSTSRESPSVSSHSAARGDFALQGSQERLSSIAISHIGQSRIQDPKLPSHTAKDDQSPVAKVQRRHNLCRRRQRIAAEETDVQQERLTYLPELLPAPLCSIDVYEYHGHQDIERYKDLWQSFLWTADSCDESDTHELPVVERCARTRPWRLPEFSKHSRCLDNLYMLKPRFDGIPAFDCPQSAYEVTVVGTSSSKDLSRIHSSPYDKDSDALKMRTVRLRYRLSTARCTDNTLTHLQRYSTSTRDEF
ncbi:hypothetical protein BC629DRAFT_1494684 [Irpex lacteus]|nr:hypothetical protein BC629DRAFT_1494684 [Irpex lacteus]